MTKHFLPIFDEPLIRFAAAEANRARIDKLILVMGRSKRAIEDHFDANLELEALRGKRKHEQTDMVHNIPSGGVECIFVLHAQQLGLGHAILCAERGLAISSSQYCLWMIFNAVSASSTSNITLDLINAFEFSGQTQLSAMQVVGAAFSNYRVIIKGDAQGYVSVIVEKQRLE